MEKFTAIAKDAETGNSKPVEFARFYNGYTCTFDKYARTRKAQAFKREVMCKAANRKRGDYQPMPNTAAPIENRLSHIYNGGESYFEDAEAAAVIPLLCADFRHVIAVRNDPREGFTRLSTSNVQFVKGDTEKVFWKGEPLF